MPNHKLYIHEFIDIIGHNRAKYMQHMTANFSPTAQRERKQLCYGVWGIVGTTRGWPEVCNLWEEDGWSGMARSFRHEFNHPTLQNPTLAAWWSVAAQLRRHGDDRLLVPAPWTRTIEELVADGVRGETYAQELIRTLPGRSAEYLARVRDIAIPTYEKYGWQLCGAFETAMVGDSECIVIWAIPRWEQWAEFEAAQRRDDAVRTWCESARELTTGFHRFLMVDSPLNPMKTGRQPRVEDQRPLEEIA
jgi:hypothetical protein